MIIDVTERPIRRPKDKEKQTSRYSGKQKRHTLKHTVITSATTGRIAYVGPSTDGRVHDKKMADTEEIRLPKGTTLYQDTGYQGFRAPGARRTHQPRKKQRGKERSDEDKAHNRLVSRTRVRVEHAIGGIKRANIIAHTFRNIKLGFDDLTVNVAAGLHNFRVASRSPTANRI